ncbi:inner-membrane translocator [Nitratireductor aquibiodomus RA22]|uniref:Amino acid/amide ABC transporter membrane protein 2, HAAT family n=2 Tax=Nitratireductor aquibiodomus TaxID=204799 RepID=A0A1H4K343_9HYPH|nr:high-affinity branched-chain amino acid ABC transporter permease LivM [Nitratireductor aquibiodomus]EIM72386.1 inner-membrane translocator [Nitratireductor aquibiodomus RA22]SEB52971.1 amino acid/amide ABC transporter membrane protein 2, HAAT family [Nitratireductor aquibiodomus]
MATNGSNRAVAAPQNDPNSFAASVKDAATAGFLVAVLGFFFIGIRTDIAPGGLDLKMRWGAWIVSILVVFVGRLLLNLFVLKTDSPITRKIAGAMPSGSRFAGTGKWLMRALFAFALVLPFFFTTFFPGKDRQFIDLAILIMTYIMLGWGLNIVVGLAGLLDLGYVAFYAVGAYSFALLAQYLDMGFWFALPLAGILAACWGIVLGFPVLRLRGDYLAIVTLAFGEIIRVVLLNWYEFTNGPDGISGIPKPTFFGLELKRGEGGFADFFGIAYDPIQRFIFLYYIIFILALITNFVTMRLRRLPIGRAWEALREDEIACRSLGINTRNTKLTAFSIGAMFGGFAGSFFATRQGFISPESFTFLESAIILAIVVLGGLGSQVGVVIASIVMIGGIEMLRNLGFLQQVFGSGFDPVQYRMLIFGLAMVLIMVWKPRGLISTREPSVVLKEKKRIGADMVAQGEGH